MHGKGERGGLGEGEKKENAKGGRVRTKMENGDTEGRDGRRRRVWRRRGKGGAKTGNREKGGEKAERREKGRRHKPRKARNGGCARGVLNVQERSHRGPGYKL